MFRTFRRHFCVVSAGLILLGAGCQHALAGTEKESTGHSFWLNAGAGLCSLGSFGGNIGFHVQTKRLLYSVRGTANSEAVGFLDGGDEFYDAAVLIGIATPQPDNYHASFSMGIARVTGSRFVESPESLFFGGKSVDINPTLGFAAQSQLFLKISRVIGMGLSVYLNLNDMKPFGGVTLGLRFGFLR